MFSIYWTIQTGKNGDSFILSDQMRSRGTLESSSATFFSFFFDKRKLWILWRDLTINVDKGRKVLFLLTSAPLVLLFFAVFLWACTQSVDCLRHLRWSWMEPINRVVLIMNSNILPRWINSIDSFDSQRAVSSTPAMLATGPQTVE